AACSPSCGPAPASPRPRRRNRKARLIVSAMLSIDFGNNYTKVGFRKDENATSVPLTSQDLRLDDYNICIPTLAANMLRDGKETWLYGTQVLSQSRGAAMQVFRNWKPASANRPTTTLLPSRNPSPWL